MYCKLQKGIKSDEYLQLNNVRKVVEPVWFDWCNSIFIQIPVIKTIHKYNQNKCESLILCVEDIKTSLYKYILLCKQTIYRYKLDMWRFPVLSRQFLPTGARCVRKKNKIKKNRLFSQSKSLLELSLNFHVYGVCQGCKWDFFQKQT